MQWYEKKYLVGQGGSYTPEEMVPILQAEEKHEYQAVVRGADDVIKREPSLFYSLPYANWVKSNAYIERGWAKFMLSKNARDGIGDLAKAAELGNMRAASNLSNGILDKYQGKADAPNIEANAQALEKFLRIGAELGNHEAAEYLGSERWPNPLSTAEKAYWFLIGFSRVTGLSAEDWDRILHADFERLGEHGIEQAITSFSPLGGLTPGGPRQPPGRGIVATLFSDAELRREYGYNYGKRAPKSRASETPSTADLFKYVGARADEVGHARAYLLVPGDRKFEDPTMISMSATEIGEHLTPSDRVVVRCGPLTHVAQIYRIDRRAGTVDFVDGLFEYWQPSHNACFTTFNLVPYKFGGFLARVSLREVVPNIQAVITFRDHITIRLSAKNSPKYVTVEQLQKSDFFKFFGVRETIEEPLGQDERVLRYMTGGFQNQVFLSVRTDKQYRIQEAALTVKRAWAGIRKEPNPYAIDIAKSFLAAATPADSAEHVQPLARAIWQSQRGSTTESADQEALRCGADSASALDAYYGEVKECRIDLPTGQFMLQNITDSYSDLVLRVKIRTEIERNN